MLRVRYNELIEELEQLTGERFTVRRICEAANVRTNTIIDLRKGRTKRVSLETLYRLMLYFREQGLEVKASELLEEVKG